MAPWRNAVLMIALCYSPALWCADPPSASPMLINIPDSERYRCARALGRNEIGFSTPTEGHASDPIQLLNNLLSDPRGPYVAWHSLDPLLGDYGTLTIAVPLLAASDLATYSRILADLSNNIPWRRSTDKRQQLISLLLAIFRLEESLAHSSFKAWRAEMKNLTVVRAQTTNKEQIRAAAEAAARAREYTFFIHAQLIAKFVQLNALPGTNWLPKEKSPFAVCINNILPAWLTLNHIDFRQEKMEVGSVTYLGFYLTGSTRNTAFRRMLRFAQGNGANSYQLILSPMTNFAGDIQQQGNGTDRTLILDVETMLHLGANEIRYRQNQLLVQGLRLASHPKALPFQASLFRRKSRETSGIPMAFIDRLKPETPALVIRKLLLGETQETTAYFGASRLLNVSAALQAINEILEETESYDEEFQYYVARIGALLSMEALDTAEAFKSAIRTILSVVDTATPELFSPGTAEIRVESRARTGIQVRGINPRQMTRVQSYYSVSGVAAGAWFAAFDRRSNGFTLTYFPQGSPTFPSLKIRVYQGDFVEISSETEVLRYSYSGIDFMEPIDGLRPLVQGEKTAAEYVQLSGRQIDYVWQLLEALKRRMSFLNSTLVPLTEQLKAIQQVTDFHLRNPSLETFARLVRSIEELTVPDIFRNTSRIITRNESEIYRGGEIVPVFPYLIEQFFGEGELANKRRILTRISMAAVLTYFQRLGYSTRDVSLDNLGHDVEVWKRGVPGIQKIEVKGVSPGVGQIVLTSNEVHSARLSRGQWRLAIIRLMPDGTCLLDFVSEEEFEAHLEQSRFSAGLNVLELLHGLNR